MAKWYLLIVKSGRQRIVKLDVNVLYFGRGVQRSVRRVQIEELIEEHLPHETDGSWYGGRVRSILPPRRLQ